MAKVTGPQPLSPKLRGVNMPLHRWFADAIATATERRKAPRVPVMIEAQKGDGRSPAVGVQVTDLAADGCRIVGSFDVAIDAEVWLAIPGLAPRRARIAWVGCGEAGCEFLFPVRDEQVEDIARAAQPRDA